MAHGALACARALPEANGFALAFGDEATALRAAGVRAPWLVIERVFSVAELHTAVRESWTFAPVFVPVSARAARQHPSEWLKARVPV